MKRTIIISSVPDIFKKKGILSTILIGNLLSLSKKLNLEITHILKDYMFFILKTEDIVIDHVNLKGFISYLIQTMFYHIGLGLEILCLRYLGNELNYSESTKQDDNKI
jgi:hypothetical protein